MIILTPYFSHRSSFPTCFQPSAAKHTSRQAGDRESVIPISTIVRLCKK